MKKLLTFTLTILLSLYFLTPAESLGKDAGLVKQLKKGQGALVIRYNYYKQKKGVDLKALAKKVGWEQALAQGAVKKGMGLAHSGKIGVLRPDKPNKEKYFKGWKSGFHRLVGPPGQYKITRGILTYGSMYQTQWNIRIHSNATIQKGKVTYLGEFNVIKHKRSREFAYTLSRQGIEEFKREFPQASQYLVAQPLVLEE